MTDLQIFLLVVVLDIGIGWLASRRGRRGTDWFMLALFFSPLVGLILLALPSLPPKAAIETDPRWAQLCSTPMLEPEPQGVIATPVALGIARTVHFASLACVLLTTVAVAILACVPAFSPVAQGRWRLTPL